jgi:hypothetical protein
MASNHLIKNDTLVQDIARTNSRLQVQGRAPTQCRAFSTTPSSMVRSAHVNQSSSTRRSIYYGWIFKRRKLANEDLPWSTCLRSHMFESQTSFCRTIAHYRRKGEDPASSYFSLHGNQRWLVDQLLWRLIRGEPHASATWIPEMIELKLPEFSRRVNQAQQEPSLTVILRRESLLHHRPYFPALQFHGIAHVDRPVPPAPKPED